MTAEIKAAIETVVIKNKSTGASWEVPVCSEAYRRCKAHPGEYEIASLPPESKKKGSE
jgi:hypothetical protein